MGYTKHHTIVVTGVNGEEVIKAREKAIKIFSKSFTGDPLFKPNGSKLISNIISGVVNSQYSFFIAPDGSNEGWGTSLDGDKARKKFLIWLHKNREDYDYIEVAFGGDDRYQEITNSSISND